MSSTETVKFTMNGQALEVPKGTTVMEAASKQKVSIPHFCWHPGLKIAGVCRFCMVDVEGRPKLEIACNLTATEGMVVRTDSEKVKEAHKWALEFHLVNHPLDCPICDQAGECGLQDYYMDVGLYDSQVNTEKVLKPKALSVGSELVLDTERCILCSRCVRFEEEVTKTGALGIFDRGDRAIIGTFDEKPITHEYQENLVDICPVGAFTSKRFRFKQRVWFLKEQESICPGCSTGCAIDIHARPELKRYYRTKPRYDEQVNKYWMCDEGRKVLDHLNPEERLNSAFYRKGKEAEHESFELGLNRLKEKLSKTPKDKVALLVTAQYTVEEYETLISWFVKNYSKDQVYLWRDDTKDIEFFDGILLRGDKNANTKGLTAVLKDHGITKSPSNELDKLLAAKPELVIALAPELENTFPHFEEHLKKLSGLPCVSLWTTSYDVSTKPGWWQLLPLKGFSEKKGHFVNAMGQKRELTHPFPSVVSEATSVQDLVNKL